VQFALTFVLQVWLFASPVVFPSSIVHGDAKFLFALNPMVGVIDGFRWALIDDPTLGRAAWRMDDEGTAPIPVTLLEDGRVSGRLLDRATAKRVGGVSTGHGRRGGYLDPVLPRMGCTYIEAGDVPAASIVRDTQRGIFVRRMAGAHADPWRGRATFVVTDADRIEGGELTQSLESFVIELDVIEALGSIDLVGDDLVFDTCIGSCVRLGQPLATSVGAPTVRLRVIRVIP